MVKKIRISLLLFLVPISIGFAQQEKDSLINNLSEIKITKTTEKSKRYSIPVETMFGHRQVNYLSILNMKLGNSERFGYFSVITVATPYNNTNQPNELIISNALTYKISNKLFATIGPQYHFIKGIVPTAGLQFLSVNSKWLFVLSTGIAFATNTSFQNVGIAEFKPRISKSLKLYTRVQGIYNYKLKNAIHERSLLYFRSGITFKKTSLGLGFNIDFYGSGKISRENIGVFIHQIL
ncbi:hypothetical protein ACOSP6_04920 [Tenacibaculum sp. MEBiC06402]|uniref:hypothetical protein n=1 Tax=unclassified Tenacibaculum TaxID=2635139 RepID=UPI003B994A08